MKMGKFQKKFNKIVLRFLFIAITKISQMKITKTMFCF